MNDFRLTKRPWLSNTRVIIIVTETFKYFINAHRFIIYMCIYWKYYWFIRFMLQRIVKKDLLADYSPMDRRGMVDGPSASYLWGHIFFWFSDESTRLVDSWQAVDTHLQVGIGLYGLSPRSQAERPNQWTSRFGSLEWVSPVPRNQENGKYLQVVGRFWKVQKSLTFFYWIVASLKQDYWGGWWGLWVGPPVDEPVFNAWMSQSCFVVEKTKYLSFQLSRTLF